MDRSFDPYHQWLGIPPDEQPPSHYRLLALRPGEADLEVIERAVERQCAFVRQFQRGLHGEVAERLLNQIAAAGDTLADPLARESYDQSIGLKATASLSLSQHQRQSLRAEARRRPAGATVPRTPDRDDLPSLRRRRAARAARAPRPPRSAAGDGSAKAIAVAVVCLVALLGLVWGTVALVNRLNGTPDAEAAQAVPESALTAENLQDQIDQVVAAADDQVRELREQAVDPRDPALLASLEDVQAQALECFGKFRYQAELAKLPGPVIDERLAAAKERVVVLTEPPPERRYAADDLAGQALTTLRRTADPDEVAVALRRLRDAPVREELRTRVNEVLLDIVRRRRGSRTAEDAVRALDPWADEETVAALEAWLPTDEALRMGRRAVVMEFLGRRGRRSSVLPLALVWDEGHREEARTALTILREDPARTEEAALAALTDDAMSLDRRRVMLRLLGVVGDADTVRKLRPFAGGGGPTAEEAQQAIEKIARRT